LESVLPVDSYAVNDKNLWNQLAKKNWKFYIYTDKGKDISEGDFILSGEEDYQRLILEDLIITAHFPHKENLTALEIGCGAGRILRPMARDFGSVIGIDVSGEMIMHARDRVDADLYETDGEHIPLEDSSVDFIFSYLVFQYIKSYVVVENNFKEVARILKPGGVFKVLMRTDLKRDKVWHDRHFQWWEGVPYKQHMIEHLVKRFHFKLLKEEILDKERTWLWVEKTTL
jgi:ubiquinone/menaquinone biosynthesis C-methylase UbiE